MDIKVRDLRQTDIIENENKLMVLVDDDLNLVKNITKEEFLTNVISSTENNALVQESDGNLYVNTSEIADSVQALDDKFTEQIGDLTDLTTEDKTNLVAAINEAASSGGGGGGRNVGEIIHSTLPLTDAGLHLLDGSLLQYGIYKEFIDYIADLYAENPSANYFTTESAWQASVTTYGSCGKFVYDSTNNTVRLPKVSDILQGTTDLSALGDLVEAGLPNITGTYRDHDNAIEGITASGCFSVTGASGRGAWNANDGQHIVTFNASRSSSIYGNSSTVQPQTIKVLYYIVIATSTKTDIQVDIDEIATDLNGKADVDLTNVTDTGYIKMAGAGMPSNRYIDLTLGASGSTYTAPANGYFYLVKRSSSTSQSMELANTSSTITVEIREVDNSSLAYGHIAVKKDDVVNIYYSLGGATSTFRFIYAQGSESEAQ